MNDSAKLVFYIAYYLILLTHKKKDIKEKKTITKDALSNPDFKEIAAFFTTEDDFDAKTEKVKGKIFKSISERISLIVFFMDNKSIKHFCKTYKEDVLSLLPTKDLINSIDQIEEENNTYFQLLKDFNNIDLENIDLEDINLNDANLHHILKSISPTYPFSIKDILLQCYAMYQCQYPSMTMVKELDAKIKNLRAIMREDYQLDSPQVEEKVSNIVEELESMYKKHKGEFTLELYSKFYKKQQHLFQIYRELDYMGFLLYRKK